MVAPLFCIAAAHHRHLARLNSSCPVVSKLADGTRSTAANKSCRLRARGSSTGGECRIWGSAITAGRRVGVDCPHKRFAVTNIDSFRSECRIEISCRHSCAVARAWGAGDHVWLVKSAL